MILFKRFEGIKPSKYAVVVSISQKNENEKKQRKTERGQRNKICLCYMTWLRVAIKFSSKYVVSSFTSSRHDRRVERNVLWLALSTVRCFSHF